MSSKTIEDLREHLFAAINGVRGDMVLNALRPARWLLMPNSLIP